MFIQGNGFEFSFLLFLHYKSHDRIIFRKYVKAGEKKKNSNNKTSSTSPGAKQQPLLSFWCISFQFQNTSNEMASFKNKNCFLKLFDGFEKWIEFFGLEEQLVFIYFVFQNLAKKHPFDMQAEQKVKEGNIRLPNWNSIDLCQHLKDPRAAPAF